MLKKGGKGKKRLGKREGVKNSWAGGQQRSWGPTRGKKGTFDAKMGKSLVLAMKGLPQDIYSDKLVCE